MRILLDECVPWPMHRLLAAAATLIQSAIATIKPGWFCRLEIP
jgi:hypothetical protein